MIPKKPIDSTWTDEQWQAIHQAGTNIIVSAGAGSGKTAVLTERIIEKLKKGVNIQNLIVLTFTKAAAFEMKVRVRKKLKSEIQKGHQNLKEQLELLDQATITTFDSYSLSLVKKYHFLLNIGSNIKIIDNIVIKIQKKKILDDIINEMFQANHPHFIQLMDTFTVKDDHKIQSSILSINDKLDTLVDKQKFLNDYIKTHYNDQVINDNINTYVHLLHKEQLKIKQLIKKMEQIIKNEKLYTFFKQLEENLQGILTSTTYDDYAYFLSIYPKVSFPRSPKIDDLEKEEVKKQYEEIKKVLEKMQELCHYKSIEQMKEIIYSTKPYAQAIIEILKQLNTRLWEYKKEQNSYEFSDITRLGLDLLEQNPEVREEVKANIHEIMIDEYQDTNDIGDYFISLISNHNVYMVGDIKQSIYRFRNANPKIFMEKYNQYTRHNDGEKIDLNKNFRSRKEVLDDINLIFEYIMDETIGGANYRQGHQMIFGNNNYEKDKPSQNYHLEILDYAYQDNEQCQGYRKEEVEAFLIANDIKQKVENNYQIYDKDKNLLRPIQYSDCAIILDRRNNFDLYKKIFTYLKVPLTLYKNEDFVTSSEIYVIRSILKLIQSFQDETYAKQNFIHAYLSFQRSFLQEKSDNDILKILEKYKNKKPISILNEERKLQKQIQELAYYSTCHSMKDLLYKIYDTFHIYEKIVKIGDAHFLSTKLEYLLNVSETFQNLEDFIAYFDFAMKDKIDMNFSLNKNTNTNTVNMMTIHASKGLEYHLCYYAGLTKEFSKEDLKEKFLFDSKLGFILPTYEEGIKETFYKEIVKNHYKEEEISERIRVFYVALTRAKEKMIIVTNLSDNENLPKIDNNQIVDTLDRLSYNSFYDILSSIHEVLKIYTTKTKIPLLTKDYEQVKEKMEQLPQDSTKKDYIEIDIHKQEKEEIHYANTKELVEQDALEYGIKIHQILEYVDFQNPSNIDKQYQPYIDKLLSQEFMKNIKKSQIYREYEFIDQTSKEEKHGIIDLMIEEEDTIYIIDYKLRKIDKPSYQEQVRGYIDYIQKITTKKVYGYLYSIQDGISLKVENEREMIATS